MERKFVLSLRYGQDSTAMTVSGKAEIIEASSMVELVSKFTILVAKLDREFHEEDVNALKSQGVIDDDIPF